PTEPTDPAEAPARRARARSARSAPIPPTTEGKRPDEKRHNIPRFHEPHGFPEKPLSVHSQRSKPKRAHPVRHRRQDSLRNRVRPKEAQWISSAGEHPSGLSPFPRLIRGKRSHRGWNFRNPVSGVSQLNDA